MSTQTFRNRFHAAILRSRRPVVRPPLTGRHRRNRLLFAHDFVHVLFTDESKFCEDFNDVRDSCITERDQFGGGSVLVWGGIS